MPLPPLMPYKPAADFLAFIAVLLIAIFIFVPGLKG
jgi:hypothetical protein